MSRDELSNKINKTEGEDNMLKQSTNGIYKCIFYPYIHTKAKY